jgi:hypothetical protein
LNKTTVLVITQAIAENNVATLASHHTMRLQDQIQGKESGTLLLARGCWMLAATAACSMQHPACS